MILQSRPEALARWVEETRKRTIDWLWSMQAEGEPRGVLRMSAHHNPRLWPGALLPGTYNGLMALDLIGGLRLSESERRGLVAWFEGARRPDGVFRVAGMTDESVFKKPDREETWRYIDFHVTNYALGAVEALDPGRPAILDFARPFLEPMRLKAWLAERDLRDPWLEGNNIVNLASFLMTIGRRGDRQEADLVKNAFDVLFAWHERLQEPSTGFWGVGQSDETRLLHAFAGSMHNFHMWYALGRPLPYQDRAVDYALSRPTAIHSACIDVDLVDLLVHAHALDDYRRRDVEAWLARMLPVLLDFQNEDGGFADVREGVRRQDGWVKGYEEPQGLSNTFAAWFRWIAIAMAADLLWPGRWTWNFRRTIGIGYRMEPRR